MAVIFAGKDYSNKYYIESAYFTKEIIQLSLEVISSVILWQ
jgi:hypothetical protein